jgi:hypothetical protein
MFQSLVTFFKWAGYVFAAVLILAIGGLFVAFAGVAISIGIALGTVYLVAYILSDWNEDDTPEKKDSPP